MRPTTYTHYNWCDKFAFSNGDLMEEGYVEQPPGFEIPGLEDLGLLHYLLGMEVYQSHGCIFLRQILDHLRIPQDTRSCVLTNNHSACALAYNSSFHDGTKLTEVHYHFIHELVASEIIVLDYFCTRKNVSDLFNQALSWGQY